jgi:hypothetical protein
MNINFNKLIVETNKRFTGNDPNLIVFAYTDDNSIRVSKGETSYFFDFKKLDKILVLNNVDYKDSNKVYEVLSKHISNQLGASLGCKSYPEIKSDASDYI